MYSQKNRLQITLTSTKAQTNALMRKLELSQAMASNYKKMFEEELMTDFELLTSDHVVIKAHKTVLAAHSPVLCTMLRTDMEEAKTGKVNIPDFDSKTMKELLRFIYCNEVENLTEIDRTLIFAAEKYQIEELKKLCIQSIIKSLTNENVLEALKASDLITKSELLFEASLNLIVR